MYGLEKRRRLSIMEGALKKRLMQCDELSIFDPILFVEQQLPKIIKNFDYHYDEMDKAFIEQPNRQAFVRFGETILLVAKESLMEAAYSGDREARFIMSHEIGHVIMHRRKMNRLKRSSSSRQQELELSRHETGTSEQYSQNTRLELEANAFAGTILCPPTALSPMHLVRDVMAKYNVSTRVAEIALKDAKVSWEAIGRKWNV